MVSRLFYVVVLCKLLILSVECAVLVCVYFVSQYLYPYLVDFYSYIFLLLNCCPLSCIVVSIILASSPGFSSLEQVARSCVK